MKVKYTGCSKEQEQWGGNDNPEAKGLIVGNIYEVEKTEVHTWHTKMFLKEIDGKFNSVCFLDTRNADRMFTELARKTEADQCQAVAKNTRAFSPGETLELFMLCRGKQR
jgi:hypothetical protein